MESVISQLPTDGNTYDWHDPVTVDGTYTNTSTSTATKDGVPGSWTFSGWTANTALTEDGVEGNVTFTGTWTFTPKKTPATGDDTNVKLWIALMLISGSMLTAICIWQKKKFD